MPSKKFWKQKSLNFLALHESSSQIKNCQIGGYDFDIFPDVFSPAISSDTRWFFESLTPFLKKQNSFLEIGTGSGVIACLAALNGVHCVTSTDINPKAVKNTLHNQAKHDVNFPVLEGSVFQPLRDRKKKFDVIFWNHPFNFTNKKLGHEDYLSYSVFDHNYEFLGEFFKESKKYLKDDGVLLLGTGNIARINMIKQLARSEGYSICLQGKKEVPIHTGSKTIMDVRLYSFKTQTLRE